MYILYNFVLCIKLKAKSDKFDCQYIKMVVVKLWNAT